MTSKDPNADDPPIAELLKAAVASEIAKIRVEIPGRIVDYDSSEQNATVQPVVRSSHRDAETGGREDYLPETIENVPVRFPQGTDGSETYAVTWPLSADDWVTLEFQSRSIDEWLSTGDTDVTPGDLRRFDVSDVIAVPGPAPLADPLPSDAIDDGAIVLSAPEIHGGKADPSNWAARDDKVVSELESLKTTIDNFVSTYNAHTHTGNQGAPTSPPIQSASAHGSIGEVKSEKVKIE